MWSSRVLLTTCVGVVPALLLMFTTLAITVRAKFVSPVRYCN